MPAAKLFLIDAHALCYRSYFAIRGLTTSKGQATNAIYGFVSTLRKILREYKPRYTAVCFDVGKKTHRQEKFAAYKIQRPTMPDDLISQIPIIKKIVEAYHLPVFECAGFEADDVIATIVHQVSKSDLDIVIVSDDKDMYQLMSENVKIFSVRKDTMLDYNQAQEQLGIAPERIVDFIGLAGDASDNIPGVNGIGEVTAKLLVKEYGKLENIFSHLDTIKSVKVKEKLSEQKAAALFSRELSLLETQVPIHFQLQDTEVKAPDPQRLFELFKELEFRKFAEEFSGTVSESARVEVKAIASSAEARALVSVIQKAGECSVLFDGGPADSLFRGMMLCAQGSMYQVADGCVADLKMIFEDTTVLKVTHNIKEVMKTLADKGISLKGKMFDVMLAGYLLDPAKLSYTVESLAWEYLKFSPSVQPRLALEVKCLAQLYPILSKQLEDKELFKLFTEIEMPLAYVLFRMETAGVKLDMGLLKNLAKEIEKNISSLEERLYKIAGTTFNLNSPKQLSQVLFERLKLPVMKKTKTGFSTDEEVLTKLAARHELPALLLEFRQLAKLKSTYIDALPKLVDAKTGRLHAYFNQVGTETGRLSSNNPNLQNIPIRTELGREIRKTFIASSKNHVIIAADYSQIELRILAHLSQDKNLAEAFRKGEDIHQFTAALIFDVPEKAVTDKMRDAAKRVNFGISYGMSAYGLAKDLNVPVAEAQDFIDKYFLRYPNVKKFMDQEIEKCRDKGYVVTLLNRRRYIPEIHNSNIVMRQFAERQAINTPVQGSAADLLKLAMINIQRELEKRKFHSQMIMTIHDELVFDVPITEKAEMIQLIEREMEHAVKLSVPIKVSVKMGNNWLQTKGMAER